MYNYVDTLELIQSQLAKELETNSKAVVDKPIQKRDIFDKIWLYQGI